jgi:uncharacterized protein (DUF58 family)
MLSRNVGTSLEFMEHREYMPGDDLRRIDWNAYARNDRLSVKLYREEVNPHVELLLDVSRSMDLPETPKGAATYALAGFFASATAESRFSFNVYITDHGCRKLGRSHLVPTEWAPFTLDAANSPADAVGLDPPNWRKRGIRVFVSDFMFLANPDLLVSQLAQGAAVTILVQLLAQEDAQPSDQGNLKLVESETNQWIESYIDTAAKHRYLKNLARHQENYNLACRRHGAVFTTLIAEQFLEEKHVDELLQRELMRQK